MAKKASEKVMRRFEERMKRVKTESDVRIIGSYCPLASIQVYKKYIMHKEGLDVMHRLRILGVLDCVMQALRLCITQSSLWGRSPPEPWRHGDIYVLA